MDLRNANYSCRTWNAWAFVNDWRWYVSDYSLGFEEMSTEGFTLVNSAAQPFRFIDYTSKASVFVISSKTSSSLEIELPERPWIVDYIDQKTIVFSEKVPFPCEITSVATSWDREVVLAQATSAGFEEVFERIGHFVKLEANWDHYGAKSIDENCVDQAFSILNQLLEWRERAESEMPVPFVAPLPTGGIQFEWDKGKRFLEISIAPETRAVYFFAMDKIDDGEISIEGSIRSEEELQQLLAWFIRGTVEDVVHLRVVGERS